MNYILNVLKRFKVCRVSQTWNGSPWGVRVTHLLWMTLENCRLAENLYEEGYPGLAICSGRDILGFTTLYLPFHHANFR